MKTSELTGKALNAAVAVAQGWTLKLNGITPIWEHENGLQTAIYYQPSTDWKQGGPILQEYRIATEPARDTGIWLAWMECFDRPDYVETNGMTKLQAGMRCFVLSKLGDTVELPEGLKL